MHTFELEICPEAQCRRGCALEVTSSEKFYMKICSIVRENSFTMICYTTRQPPLSINPRLCHNMMKKGKRNSARFSQFYMASLFLSIHPPASEALFVEIPLYKFETRRKKYSVRVSRIQLAPTLTSLFRWPTEKKAQP